MFRALPSATEEQGSEGSGIGPWPNGARKRAASAEEHLAGGAAEVRSVPQTTFGRVWRPATMVLFVAAPLACPPWVTPALSDVFHAVEEAIEPRHVLETLRR